MIVPVEPKETEVQKSIERNQEKLMLMLFSCPTNTLLLIKKVRLLLETRKHWSNWIDGIDSNVFERAVQQKITSLPVESTSNGFIFLNFFKRKNTINDNLRFLFYWTLSRMGKMFYRINKLLVLRCLNLDNYNSYFRELFSMALVFRFNDCVTNDLLENTVPTSNLAFQVRAVSFRPEHSKAKRNLQINKTVRSKGQIISRLLRNFRRPEKVLMDWCDDSKYWETGRILFRKIKELRSTLASKNLRLVSSVVKRSCSRGLALKDLIQEGSVGLMKAIERFEPRKSCQFSTYATWWIRQSINEFLLGGTKVINLPSSVQSISIRLNQIIKDHIRRTGLEPSVKYLSSRTKLSEERIKKIIGIIRSPLSLGSIEFLDEDLKVTTVGHSEGLTVSPDKVFLQDEVKESLSSLSTREERIIRMRFGIEVSSTYTLEEVGKRFHITKERVRQIEAKALKKIRQSERSEVLKFIVERTRKPE